MEGAVHEDRESGEEYATTRDSDESQSLSPFQKVERRKRGRNSPPGQSDKSGKRARRRAKTGPQTGNTPRPLGSPSQLSDSSSSSEGELDHESDMESLGDPRIDDTQANQKATDNKREAEAKANPTQTHKMSYAQAAARGAAPHGRRGVRGPETAPVFCQYPVILEDQMILTEPARLAVSIRGHIPVPKVEGVVSIHIDATEAEIKQAIESNVTVVEVKRLTLKSGEKSRAVKVTLAETTLPDHLVINRQEYGLQRYLQGKPKVDVLMLQSLNVRHQALPHLDGYYYPPAVDMEKGRVMVATYVSTRLTYVDADPLTHVNPRTLGDCRLNLRSLTVSLSGGKELTLVNVYYPDGIPDGSACDWLKNLGAQTPDARRTWVVAGDFNASHRLWDPDATTAGGRHLANAVLESNLSILNDCSVTRIGQGGQRNSAIDITLASPALCLEATWETGDDNMQSDHLPIHITLDQAVPTEVEVNSDPKYAYDKADWEKFRTLLEAECEHLNRNSPDQDIDSKYEEIRSMILTAANAAIPQSRPQPSGGGRLIGGWWNAECEEATAEKRRVLRAFKRNMTEENRELVRAATTHCSEVAEKARQEHWERFCTEQVQEPKDSSKLWRMIRSHRRRGRLPERALLVNGQKTQTAKEKANALAETFAKASQTEHLPPEMREYRRTEEQRFEKSENDGQAPSNGGLTLEELRTAIGSLGSQERLVRDRLEYHLEKHGIIPLCQAGFRKGRGCMEHVASLTSEIKKAMVNKHSVVTTFFDIKRAFDTVWHAKRLDKLSSIGISGRLYQFVQAFLADRRISVRVGASLSDEHTLDMGVPQGSVIAPTLFSVMLHDIEAKVGRPDIKMSLYADDLAIWTELPTQLPGKTAFMKKLYERWRTKFQSCVDDIQGYMGQNGFQLSPEKTSLVVFSRTNGAKNAMSIQIGNVTIKPCSEAKFLGVTLNERLRWQPHISNLTAKAARSVNLIKILSAERWATPRSLIHLTNALAAMHATETTLGDGLTETVTKETLIRQGLEVKAPRIYRTTIPMAEHTNDIWSECGAKPEVAQTPKPVFPPWELAKPEYEHRYAEGASKKADSALATTLAREKIEQRFSQHLKIYTDGSVLDSGEVGCAFVIPDLGITRRYKLNAGLSIFSAEMYAILMACTFVNDIQTPAGGGHSVRLKVFTPSPRERGHEE
nr:hypothetical protein BaRGS_020723 [Batillaria attramentaria]